MRQAQRECFDLRKNIVDQNIGTNTRIAADQIFRQRCGLDVVIRLAGIRQASSNAQKGCIARQEYGADSAADPHAQKVFHVDLPDLAEVVLVPRLTALTGGGRLREPWYRHC